MQRETGHGDPSLRGESRVLLVSGHCLAIVLGISEVWVLASFLVATGEPGQALGHRQYLA